MGKMKKRILIGVICVVLLLAGITILSVLSGRTIKQKVKLTYDQKMDVEADYEAKGSIAEWDAGMEVMEEAAYDYDSNDYAATEEVMMDESTAEAPKTGANKLSELEVQGDYIHWIYDSNVETTEYDKLASDIADVVRDAQGYVEDSETYTREYQNSSLTERYTVRRGSFIIRVPNESVEKIDAILKEGSDIISNRKYSEDLTESYIDAETKLAGLSAERKKLNRLLQDADEIQDILAINDRISEIDQYLDMYNKQLQMMKKDIDYVTYNLVVDEVIYYEDTVKKYSSGVLEQWARTTEEWISDIVPIAFFALITAIPFLFAVGFTIVKTSKKVVDYKISRSVKVVETEQTEEDENVQL